MKKLLFMLMITMLVACSNGVTSHTIVYELTYQNGDTEMVATNDAKPYLVEGEFRYVYQGEFRTISGVRKWTLIPETGVGWSTKEKEVSDEQ